MAKTLEPIIAEEPPVFLDPDLDVRMERIQASITRIKELMASLQQEYPDGK